MDFEVAVVDELLLAAVALEPLTHLWTEKIRIIMGRPGLRIQMRITQIRNSIIKTGSELRLIT